MYWPKPYEFKNTMIWRIPISSLSFFPPLAALGHGLAYQPSADEDRRILILDVEVS